MSAEFPPTPSRRTKIAVVIAVLATFAYSVVIAGQILLWFVLVGIVVGAYIAWLLVIAVFRLVEAVERLAAAKEAEVGSDNRTSDAVDDDT
ncbi:NAD(P)(+) transhydrogenase (Re/Si-specific) subunit beta [Halobellus captivus]|uniref:NAD(P)(+) transhydrogenase (Re/Si-specific) subunit beta n=1 Tax=Halobellus captivus TaxID=2592614 RepID=UPI0011A247EC|nr:NAD(P)(+) transhydrogenase (Re/Si-specific) subunit beta [Halobellus captivus]